MVGKNVDTTGRQHTTIILKVKLLFECFFHFPVRGEGVEVGGLFFQTWPISQSIALFCACKAWHSRWRVLFAPI